ncbi:MAG: Acetylglutamate kinase [Acidobacteriales bacterium]|nr:Acetylglutamate kinase [Terriglobales bacterium]
MKVVVKIGGAALDDKALRLKCARAVADLADKHSVAVVHGGGAALTRTMKQLGKTSEFINGLRVTDAETRDIALMVLGGQMNKNLVSAINALGQSAIGMCGGDGLSFRARKKAYAGGDLGFVGEICAADPKWIHAIWKCNAVPVISSLAPGSDGQYYNINADQMAAACAVACEADALIFLTDVSGVKDANGDVIRWLEANQISGLIQNAVISGGMLPKLEACQQALRKGVRRVRILPAAEASCIPDFYVHKIEYGTEVMVAVA